MFWMKDQNKCCYLIDGWMDGWMDGEFIDVYILYTDTYCSYRQSNVVSVLIQAIHVCLSMLFQVGSFDVKSKCVDF